jgi:hypothetical protein
MTPKAKCQCDDRIEHMVLNPAHTSSYFDANYHLIDFGPNGWWSRNKSKMQLLTEPCAQVFMVWNKGGGSPEVIGGANWKDYEDFSCGSHFILSWSHLPGMQDPVVYGIQYSDGSWLRNDGYATHPGQVNQAWSGTYAEAERMLELQAPLDSRLGQAKVAKLPIGQ